MNPVQEIFIDNKSETGILMLHGFGNTNAEFDEMIEYFAGKGFTVLAPITGGHGATLDAFAKSTPEVWTSSIMEAYLKLKGKCKNIFIIGNSFGANLAFWLVNEVSGENKIIGVATLAAPIKLRYHNFINLRYYLYGWMQKYYRLPKRVFKKDGRYTLVGSAFNAIPIKTLRFFLDFINENSKILKSVKIPIFIVHSSGDPLVHPKSAKYIYKHVGSDIKKLRFFKSKFHIISSDKCRQELFDELFDFYKEIAK